MNSLLQNSGSNCRIREKNKNKQKTNLYFYMINKYFSFLSQKSVKLNPETGITPWYV